MMFNSQWAPNGGDGWLKILRFSPQGDLFDAFRYSPVVERHRRDRMRRQFFAAERGFMDGRSVIADERSPIYATSEEFPALESTLQDIPRHRAGFGGRTVGNGNRESSGSRS